jgi:hypothetical protein
MLFMISTPIRSGISNREVVVSGHSIDKSPNNQSKQIRGWCQVRCPGRPVDLVLLREEPQTAVFLVAGDERLIECQDQ